MITEEIGDIVFDYRENRLFKIVSQPEFIANNFQGYYIAELQDLETGKIEKKTMKYCILKQKGK